jgi:phosphate/sulfate permease
MSTAAPLAAPGALPLATTAPPAASAPFLDPAAQLWVLVVAGLALLYMAVGIGANDCANNFATAYGSGAIGFRRCVALAALMEGAGAALLGARVGETFRKGIADPAAVSGAGDRNDGFYLYAGMTATLVCLGCKIIVGFGVHFARKKSL